MKRLLLFLLVVTLPFGSFAQSVDSLLRVVKTMPEDTNRVMTFRQLFLAYYGLDQQPEMLDVAEKGLVLSRKLQFAKGIDLFLFYKASSLDIMGKSNEAIPYFEEGLNGLKNKAIKKPLPITTSTSERPTTALATSTRLCNITFPRTVSTRNSTCKKTSPRF